MIITALNEGPNESRVAITPSVIKHYIKLGFEVFCEQNAGLAAGFSDEDYQKAGANINTNRNELLQKTNILVSLNEPELAILKDLKTEALVIAHIDNNPDNKSFALCHQKHISMFSMNLIPRISRAQSMDSLSSQANLAGYRAVLEGVQHFKRAIPMMMTAAGMIQPAKVLILGAGVAGLQAIATAKRLGAVVQAFDVRKAAKEQVESLGAEFIEVSDNQDNETKGGYAKEMSEEYKALQAALIHQHASQADIVVSTALIPGKKAPVLITKASVESMKPGSVIVDLATSRGGNCEVSVCDKIIQHGKVTIVGYSNLAGLVPATASELYSNNLVNLIKLFAVQPGVIAYNPDDEIIQQALLCHNNQYLPFQKTKEALA